MAEVQSRASVIGKLLAQAVRFGLVGLLNTFVDLALFSLLVLLPPFAALPAAAKALSFLAGVLNSYVLNARWTFRAGTSPRTLVRFAVVSLMMLGLNVLAFQTVLTTTASKPLALLAATAATFGIGFVLNRLWTFRS
jgi:putative flippase GtrA